VLHDGLLVAQGVKHVEVVATLDGAAGVLRSGRVLRLVHDVRLSEVALRRESDNKTLLATSAPTSFVFFHLLLVWKLACCCFLRSACEIRPCIKSQSEIKALLIQYTYFTVLGPLASTSGWDLLHRRDVIPAVRDLSTLVAFFGS
jgi:hypothetical protein